MPRLLAFLSSFVVATALTGCGEDRSPPTSDRTRRAVSDDARGHDAEPRRGRFGVHEDLAAALDEALASDPVAVGLGELHQTHATEHVKSTLQRFTGELLPRLAPSTSDIVVETWIREGRCGATEKQVNETVTADTERPKVTESELSVLARKARKLGVRPHALEMSCEDYASVLGDDDRIDYELFLELLGNRLGATTAAVLKKRPDDRERPRIVVYGGALHNDLYPAAGLERWSYAPGLSEALDGDYVEIDLLVPEMIEAREDAGDEDWYPIYRDHAGPDSVILIERRPRAFTIILREGVHAE